MRKRQSDDCWLDEFAGRRVAISGATGGLGSEIAYLFAKAKANLVLVDCIETPLQLLAKELRAEYVVCNQERLENIHPAVAKMGSVEIFINNAGFTIREPLLEMSHQAIRSVIDVNLTGGMLMAIEVARAMAPSKRGVILNVCSQIAFAGGKNRGAYAASKAGLVQFTKTSAVEWFPLGIRVVGIAPGAADTPMTKDLQASPDAVTYIKSRVPSGRFIPAYEIAHIAAFLASDKCQSIVGQTIVADDGFLLT